MVEPVAPESELKARIGARVRAERETAGLTQRDLANKVGIDEPRVSRIENGQRGIDSLLLHRLASALGLAMEAFFEEGPADTVVMHRGRGESDDDAGAMVEWALQLREGIDFVDGEYEARYG